MTRHKLRALARAYRRLPWMMGDALNDMEDERGEEANAYLQQDTGLSEAQLYDFARVARHWPPEDRVFHLPWSFYRDAGTEIGVARRVLASTVKMGWSREQMRACLRKIREMEDGEWS